jgi:hypothetical protein
MVGHLPGLEKNRIVTCNPASLPGCPTARSVFDFRLIKINNSIGPSRAAYTTGNALGRGYDWLASPLHVTKIDERRRVQ